MTRLWPPLVASRNSLKPSDRIHSSDNAGDWPPILLRAASCQIMCRGPFLIWWEFPLALTHWFCHWVGRNRQALQKGQNVRLLAVQIALAQLSYSNICTDNRIISDYSRKIVWNSHTFVKFMAVCANTCLLLHHIDLIPIQWIYVWAGKFGDSGCTLPSAMRSVAFWYRIEADLTRWAWPRYLMLFRSQ